LHYFFFSEILIDAINLVLKISSLAVVAAAVAEFPAAEVAVATFYWRR
jgi:hypothetical protein